MSAMPAETRRQDPLELESSVGVSLACVLRVELRSSAGTEYAFLNHLASPGKD